MNLEELGRAAGEALPGIMGGDEVRGVRRLPGSLVGRDASKI